MMMTRTSGATSGQLGNIRFGNTNIDSNLANIGAFQDGATDAAYIAFVTQSSGAATAERLRIGLGKQILDGCVRLKSQTRNPTAFGDIHLASIMN